MHWRFRKSFPIIGHFLHVTVSKKGVSLNLHAGLLSRSWGTRGNTTSVDAPGHFGLYFRKQTRRPQGREHRDEALSVRHEHRWLHLSLALALLCALVEAWHVWVHPFSDMRITGHPLRDLVLLTGLLIVLILTLHHLRIASGIILFLLALVGIYAQWASFHKLDWHDPRPVVTPAAQTAPAPQASAPRAIAVHRGHSKARQAGRLAHRAP
jgi:hypothetical protein